MIQIKKTLLFGEHPSESRFLYKASVDSNTILIEDVESDPYGLYIYIDIDDWNQINKFIKNEIENNG
jgi:hypothetical protein